MTDRQSDIREELCRVIRLNKDRWTPTSIVLERLDEHFGDDVIPSLIQCLSDGHPEIRQLTVQLLAAARPRSDVAVLALVERMGDKAWLVVTTTMHVLGTFGPLAAAAIPQIQGWLESPNE